MWTLCRKRLGALIAERDASFLETHLTRPCHVIDLEDVRAARVEAALMLGPADGAAPLGHLPLLPARRWC